MTPGLKEIIGVLADLENLCGQLVVLADSEREALIGQDLEKLNLISASKNALSRKIVGARDLARQLTGDLAPAGGRPETRPETIDQLLPFLPEEDQKLLSGSYRAYKDVARKVEYHNAHNMILASQGLKAIEGRVADLVSAIQGSDMTYKPPGRTIDPAPSRLGRVHREA